MKNKKITTEIAVEQKLQSQNLSYLKIESAISVFNCLENFSASYDAILINNPNEFNLSILQTNSEDHFYLGFDDKIESNGIIPVNKYSGLNTLGLSEKTIVIFKNNDLADRFLKSWFNNPASHFFNFRGVTK